MRSRPYDPTTPVAHEFPGIRHFDTALCHLVNNRTRGLAILLMLSNELYFRNPPRGFYADLTVSLDDPTAGMPLVSTTTRIHMSRYERETTVRIDLPLRGASLEDGQVYNVTVKYSGILLARTEARFYNLLRIGLPPTKWFYPVSGSAKIETPLRSSLLTAHSRAKVCFMVENKLSPVISLPTLQIHVTAPDDTTFIHDAITGGNQNEPFGRLYVGSEFSLSQRGVYYAELRCMGYPVAGLLFSTEEGAVAVKQTKKDLFPHTGDSYEERVLRFDHLVKRESRRGGSPSDTVVIPLHSSARYMSI